MAAIMVPTALNIIQERISDAAGLNRANEDGVRRVLVAGYINIGAVPVSFCPASGRLLPAAALFITSVLVHDSLAVASAVDVHPPSTSGFPRNQNVQLVRQGAYQLTLSLFTHSLIIYSLTHAGYLV